MNSFVRINAAVSSSPAANPLKCGDNILDLMDKAPDGDINVFPSLALMPPSSGSLFNQKNMIAKVKRSFLAIVDNTKNREGYYILGLPVYDRGRTMAALAVVNKGEIISILPDNNAYPVLDEDDSFDADIFQCGELRFSLCSCREGEMLTMAEKMNENGCGLMIFTSYYARKAGNFDKILDTARIISESYNSAVLLVNGGIGDTSSPYMYEGMTALFEDGKNVFYEASSDREIVKTCDLDPEFLKKKITRGNRENSFYIEVMKKEGILRNAEKYPFVPKDKFLRERYLDELFDMQVDSLVKRLKNAHIRHAVIGVSGGLDSTLALMAACKAFDIANLPRENLYCITMPGFGTSDRTYFNALGLMEVLGVTREDISIRAAVLQHFEDIGHNPDDKNITYENAQARERTQILMDIANEVNGFVIGTGDLSESALGWCTFGGDSIAGYNVNICIPKTVIRMMVARLSQISAIKGTEEYLMDVLATPVSPELLPPEEEGEISQKTEEILGSYELHDFFLYHILKYGLSPEKLFFYAEKAFGDEIAPRNIKSALKTFLKRFYSSQFKRTMSPDFADITEINLSNHNYMIPSDLDINYILGEADDIEI